MKKIIWIHPEIAGAWVASLEEMNGEFFDKTWHTTIYWNAFKREQFSFWSYV